MIKRRLICFALILLITGCSQVFHKSVSRIEAVIPAMNTEDWAADWWELRHEEKLALLKKDEFDLVMIGDSITHGWEGEWCDSVVKVRDEYYGHRKVLNLGFSGDRTENVLWRLQHGEVDGISPKVTVLMIGTNNTGSRMDPAEDTASGIKAIIEELQTRLPKTNILLLAIFPRGKTAEDEMRLRNEEINGIISDFADNRRVFYLNINHVFLDETGRPSKTVMPDYLHPNARGYRLWAEAMEPTLRLLLN